jgi:transcription elongation factor GreA
MVEGLVEQPVVLTSQGRERLGSRLAQATDAMRQMAERFGQRSDVDAGDYGDYLRLSDQVAVLRKVLQNAQEPGAVPEDPTIVEVGDEVAVEFADGDVEHYVVVHPIEAGLDDQRVSAASPLGTALLGRRVGDRVTVRAPAGAYECTVRSRARAT